eukprot:g2080.t1
MIREMEWVSLIMLQVEQEVTMGVFQAHLTEDGEALLEWMRQHLQPHQIIKEFKSSPHTAHIMQEAQSYVDTHYAADFARQKARMLSKVFDLVIHRRGITMDQLDAYTLEHGDDMQRAMDQLNRMIETPELPNFEPPESFTNERCLKYVEAACQLVEGTFAQALSHAITPGNPLRVLEALLDSERFRVLMHRLDAEYGLVNADHRAELLQ